MAHRVVSGLREWFSSALNRRVVSLLGMLLLAGMVLVAQPGSALASRRQLTNASSVKQVQKDVEKLEPDRPVERELAGGEAHTYELALRAGQFLQAVVDQRGIDVVVAIFSPGGDQILEVDTPNGAQGPESIFLVPEQGGRYRLDVRSLNKGAQAGKYELRIKESREAGPKDVSRALGERALAEAERLLRTQTALAKQASMEKFKEALVLMRAAECREREADALTGIAKIHYSRGEGHEALEYYDQTLTIRQELDDRRLEAFTLNDLGTVYYFLGEPRKALDYYDRTLAIKRALGDRRAEAPTLINIGMAYDSLGEKQKALDHFNEALTLVKYALTEAAILNNIGYVYNSIGERKKALEFFNRVLPIVKATGARPEEASALNNIGMVHNFLGDQQKALDCFNQALQIEHEIDFPREEATTLNNIGLTYISLGEPQTALEYFNKALTIVKAIGVRAKQAAILYNIGTVYNSAGENQKALDYFNQALPIVQAAGARKEEPAILFDMARAERALGRLTQARKHAEAALEIIELLRVKVARPEFRSSFLASIHQYYEFYIDLLMHIHKHDLAKGADAAAFQAAERARARTLLEGLIEAHADIRKGADPKLLDQERDVQTSLNSKTERLIRLINGKHTPEQAAGAQKDVDELLSRYQDVQLQIRKKSPQYAALTQPIPLSLEEVQQQVLDPDTILLEYSLGEDRSYLWVVTQSSLTSFELPKREEIETAARRVYDLLTERNHGKFGTDDERRSRVAKADAQSLKALADLSRMVLGPASAALTKKRLLVVSDGALQYVPFAALPFPGKTARSAERGRPLILDHEIISLPSASTLAVLRSELNARKPAPKLLAVLADPVFERDDPRVVSRSSKAEPVMNSESPNKRRAHANAPETGLEESELVRSLTYPGIADESGRIRRLPFTRQEAKSIASLVGSDDKLEALDFDASLATAMSPEIGRYRYLHFATHAILNSEHPQLSGIVLSLVDKHGGEQDGYLKAYEVYNLKLNAELVVLSSCQTALGKEVKGEGLVSLTRGFMYASAARVLASLWNVSDEATAQLMANFYLDLLGSRQLSPSAAIRAAQIKMLKVKKWQSPYYWAGFTLQGEPR